MEDLVFIQQFILTGLAAGTISVNAELDVPEAGQSTIRGVAISNVVDSEDITTTLQNITRIVLNYNIEEVTVKITLNIISKSRHKSDTPETTFFYLKVNPVVVDTPTLAATDVTVSLEPTIQDRKQLEDYNAIQNNAQTQRLNKLQQVVNNIQPYTVNGKVRPLPQNLDNLIEGTADSAETVRSNYTTAGLVNARYLGSQTGLVDYLGVPAYTLLKEFRGIPYVDSVEINRINSAYLESLKPFTLYHSGIKSLPDIAETGRILSDTVQPILAVETVLTLNNFFVSRVKLIPNQLLRLEFGSTGADFELVRFIKIQSTTSTSTKVSVVRGIDKEPLTGNIFTIQALDPCQIFRVDSSKLSPLANSWTFIADIETYFRTDKFGFVFSRSEPELTT